MRLATISLLALAALSGCVALHAEVPEQMVRRHIAHEQGIELGAICAHDGQNYSEGAIVCMAERRMTCDANERWLQDGEC